VEAHFRNRPPALQEAFDRLTTAVQSWGPARVQPVKTKIRFSWDHAFFGVTVRPDHLE